MRSAIGILALIFLLVPLSIQAQETPQAICKATLTPSPQFSDALNPIPNLPELEQLVPSQLRYQSSEGTVFRSAHDIVLQSLNDHDPNYELGRSKGASFETIKNLSISLRTTPGIYQVLESQGEYHSGMCLPVSSATFLEAYYEKFLSQFAMKKIWAIGNFPNGPLISIGGHGIHFSFHAALTIRDFDGVWWVIDPTIMEEPLEVSQWYALMALWNTPNREGFSVNPRANLFTLYITSPDRTSTMSKVPKYLEAGLHPKMREFWTQYFHGRPEIFSDLTEDGIAIDDGAPSAK